MPLRSYDPTIARWNRIDPVTHHSLSTYNGFDNNPIYYADPSGGNSFRGGHANRLQRMRDQYYGSEYSNLDSFVGRVNDHSTTFDDNNNRPGVVYQATNYGNNLTAALNDLGVNYTIGHTDPKKRTVTMMTEDLVAYGTDGDRYGEMPDWIDAMDVGHYETSFSGSIEEYNAKHGTDYEYGDYGKWYYDNHYAPELSALRGSIQAAQSEAGEAMMYILPLGPTAVVGGVKGAITIGRFSKYLKNSFQVLKSPLVFRNVSIRGLGQTTFKIGLRNKSSNFMIRLERDMMKARRGSHFKATHINIHKPGNYNYHIKLNPLKWFK